MIVSLPHVHHTPHVHPGDGIATPASFYKHHPHSNKHHPPSSKQHHHSIIHHSQQDGAAASARQPLRSLQAGARGRGVPITHTGPREGDEGGPSSIRASPPTIYCTPRLHLPTTTPRHTRSVSRQLEVHTGCLLGQQPLVNNHWSTNMNQHSTTHTYKYNPLFSHRTCACPCRGIWSWRCPHRSHPPPTATPRCTCWRNVVHLPMYSADGALVMVSLTVATLPIYNQHHQWCCLVYHHFILRVHIQHTASRI